METEDLDQILNKSYSELSAAERETIQEICSSEEEFVQLQQFFASVESYARDTHNNSMPAPETKERLDDLFHQTYQSKGILWYNSMWVSLYPAEKRFDQRPLVRIAAILVVLISIVPLLNKPETKTEMLAKTETVQKEKAAVSESANEEVKTDEPTTKTASFKKVQKAKTGSVNVSPVLIAAIDQVSAQQFTYNKDTDRSETIVTAYTFSAPVSVHPDGIYMGNFEADDFNVSSNLAVLDLLTPTF